jgi:transposase
LTTSPISISGRDPPQKEPRGDSFEAICCGGGKTAIPGSLSVIQIMHPNDTNNSREVGVGKERHILLILDKAGWHTGGDLELPEGMHLEFLPSGSPELQPTERLWPLTNEALANRLFEEIEQIEQTLMSRCVELLDQSELIKDLTNYHWLPQAA